MEGQQAAASRPTHPDAESLMHAAEAAFAGGRLQDAIAAIRGALRLAPDMADGHARLGQLLLVDRRPARAVAAFREALRLRPESAELSAQLALALREAGQFPQAAQALQMALARDPDQPAALRMMAQALAAAGRTEDAQSLLRRRLRAIPQDVEAYTDLAEMLYRAGRLRDAVPLYEAAHHLAPERTDVIVWLVECLLADRQPSRAEAFSAKAASLEPDNAQVQNSRVRPLFDLGRLREAEAACRRALALRPDFAAAWANLGNVLSDCGDLLGARDAYAAALRLQPGMASAEAGLGLLDLSEGRYEDGFKRYEARLVVAGGPDFGRPRWRGEPLDGRTVLLHAEQGQGDAIQFARYVPMIEASGRVLLLVPRSLGRLLETLPGTARVITDQNSLPEFDLQCPLPSLPLTLGTTLRTIPADIPYLRAEPERVRDWRARLQAWSGKKIGLVWAGAADFARDSKRSVPLDLLRPLLGVVGAAFVPLQKGRPGEWAEVVPHGLPDWSAEWNDFADTAALADALDLVIAVDTAVLHLAGALGKPAWLLNRADTDWRWMRDRSDSPWYPTLRIFRQAVAGDWRDVVAACAEALTMWLSDRRSA